MSYNYLWTLLCREVSVRVYPSEQTVGQGSDVVFQCRDEGLARANVSWTRPAGLAWPATITQDRLVQIISCCCLLIAKSSIPPPPLKYCLGVDF